MERGREKKTKEVMQRQSLTTSHKYRDTQPDPKGWLPAPNPLSLSFY